MALVTVCDKCLSLLDGKDEVKIEYKYKERPDSIMSTRVNYHLCTKCFEEIFGEGVLEELKSKGNRG